MQHVHHDMIVEWAKNSEREVEYWHNTEKIWIKIPFPSWDPDLKYRFVPKPIIGWVRCYKHVGSESDDPFSHVFESYKEARDYPLSNCFTWVSDPVEVLFYSKEDESCILL